MDESTNNQEQSNVDNRQETNINNNSTDIDNKANDNETVNSETKTFTQDELDKIINKRLAREKKNWQSTIEEEKKKASMTEVEKLKSEKDEVIKKAKGIMQNANQKLLKAETKNLATEMGIVDSDIAFMLLNKDDLVDENGEIDASELKKQLEEIIKNKPYLKQNQSNNLPNLNNFNSTKNTGTLSYEQLKQMTAQQIAKLPVQLVNDVLKNHK